MAEYAIMLAVILITVVGCSFLGFGSIAVAAAGIAKILFYIFLILFVVSNPRAITTGMVGDSEDEDLCRLGLRGVCGS